MPSEPHTDLSRRKLLALSGGAVLIAAKPLPAFAAPQDLLDAQRSLFGALPVREGRVSLELPPISENGYSVPIKVSVDSPMTQDDYVKRIAILSPRNPLPLVAQFHLSPASGRAHVEGRIRLGGTQAIQAIAEMSDGTLWSGSMQTVVTLAACVVL